MWDISRDIMIVFLVHIHCMIWGMLFWLYDAVIVYDIHVVLIICCNFTRFVCYKYFFSHQNIKTSPIFSCCFHFSWIFSCKPVSEWHATVLACTNTRQYLFRLAMVTCAKLYMTSSLYPNTSASVLSYLF